MNIKTDYGKRKINVIHKSVTGSTNADALACPENTLVVADMQTAGRGRLGRSFLSPPGGVYMSLSLGNAGDAAFITTSAAVAAAKAAEATAGTDIPVYIKWVNDLYRGGRKICGILAQLQTRRGGTNTVLGVGLNLVQKQKLDKSLESKAGYLFCGGDFDSLRQSFINCFLSAFFTLYDGACREEIFCEYKKRDWLFGKTVTFTKGGKSITGTAAGVDENINYLVDCGGKTAVLKSGEVTLTGISRQ